MMWTLAKLTPAPLFLSPHPPPRKNFPKLWRNTCRSGSGIEKTGTSISSPLKDRTANAAQWAILRMGTVRHLRSRKRRQSASFCMEAGWSWCTRSSHLHPGVDSLPVRANLSTTSWKVLSKTSNLLITGGNLTTWLALPTLPAGRGSWTRMAGGSQRKARV